MSAGRYPISASWLRRVLVARLLLPLVPTAMLTPPGVICASGMMPTSQRKRTFGVRHEIARVGEIRVADLILRQPVHRRLAADQHAAVEDIQPNRRHARCALGEQADETCSDDQKRAHQKRVKDCRRVPGAIGKAASSQRTTPVLKQEAACNYHSFSESQKVSGRAV